MNLIKNKMECKIDYWGCVYHACMSNDCQKTIVQEQGLNWGKGRCECESDEEYDNQLK